MTQHCLIKFEHAALVYMKRNEHMKFNVFITKIMAIKLNNQKFCPDYDLEWFIRFVCERRVFKPLGFALWFKRAPQAYKSN